MKLALFDIDGTLTETKSGNDFGVDPYDYKARVDSMSYLESLKVQGYKHFFGISNQGGVHSGFKSFQDCVLEQIYKLSIFGFYLEGIYFCPDAGNTCYFVNGEGALIKNVGVGFRKPDPNMLKLAIIEHSNKVYINECLFHGDLDTDKLAAESLNMPYRDVQASFKQWLQ